MPQETIPSKIEEIMKEISRRCYEDDELWRIIKEKDVKSILEGYIKQLLPQEQSKIETKKRYTEEQIQEAIQIIIEENRATATLLQRKLWISFAIAADIIYELENRGIVWPQEWAKPRKIYI